MTGRQFILIVFVILLLIIVVVLQLSTKGLDLDRDLPLSQERLKDLFCEETSRNTIIRENPFTKQDVEYWRVVYYCRGDSTVPPGFYDVDILK